MGRGGGSVGVRGWGRAWGAEFLRSRLGDGENLSDQNRLLHLNVGAIGAKKNPNHFIGGGGVEGTLDPSNIPPPPSWGCTVVKRNSGRPPSLRSLQVSSL